MPKNDINELGYCIRRWVYGVLIVAVLASWGWWLWRWI